MTTDQKKKYEEAIKSITPTIEIIEHAHSEGWNEALYFIIKMIAEQKSLSEAFYDKAHDSESAAESQLCAKLINELKKLRK